MESCIAPERATNATNQVRERQQLSRAGTLHARHPFSHSPRFSLALLVHIYHFQVSNTWNDNDNNNKNERGGERQTDAAIIAIAIKTTDRKKWIDTETSNIP